MTDHMPTESWPQSLPPLTLDVTPGMVATHAALVQDFNPLHLDQAFAAQTPFGGTIIHGSLMMNLLAEAAERAFGPDIGDFALDLRFAAPARVGETLTVGGTRAPDAPDHYDIWIETSDGTRVVTGTLDLGQDMKENDNA